MDLKLDPKTAPFRDPRYAPRELEIERREGGVLVLTNPAPFSTRFQTATGALEHWAEAAPDRTWLAERSGEGWRRVSFSEAVAIIRALAGGLHELGVVSAAPLLILSRNAVDHALIKYAAMSQGLPAAPVSPQYGLAGANLTRLAHAVEVLKPGAIFTEDAAMFTAALEAPFLAGLPVIAARNARTVDIPLERLAAAKPATASAQPLDTAKYLLTSGSTGHPKAVIFTHRGLALNSAQITACFDDPDPPVLINSAPWSHSLGAHSVLHQSAHRGGTLHIDAGQPVAGRFEETLRNLREISPTYHNMVPAGWMLFAGELERDPALARTFFARVRVVQYGGAPMGQQVNDRIQAVAVATVGEKISFSSAFGATETGPTASLITWPNERMGGVGLPVPGTSVKLVPSGDKLEFRVKGPQVTPGYLGLPELSAQAFDEEGYYRLGDAVRLIDPEDPTQGMAFNGRLSENFKLSSGTFVSVGDLRVAVVSAIGDAVTDGVVCGEGRDQVGLLFYPNPGWEQAAIQAAVRAGVERYNSGAKGAGAKVARALVLGSAPDAAAGEITDKGYIAQALARTRRAEAVERLFAEPAAAEVLVF